MITRFFQSIVPRYITQHSGVVYRGYPTMRQAIQGRRAMAHLQHVCLVIMCIYYPCLSDTHVVFNTTKSMYNVGENVTMICNVSTNWLTVSFRRNDAFIGHCFKPVPTCAKEPFADRRYDLQLHKSHSSFVITNVTMEDNGVEFECQWTTYTASLNLSITDEATSSPSPSDNDNSTDETPIVLILGVIGGSLLVGLLVVTFIVIRCVKKYREHTHTEHDAASSNDIELSDNIATRRNENQSYEKLPQNEKMENTEKCGTDEI